MKLRIATYNIHKGVSSLAQRPRIHTLKRAIRSIDADIVFLQEVRGHHEFLAARLDSPILTISQHEFLAGRLYHSAYGMNAVYDHGHHGNALLSRYRIMHTENIDVSDHPLESRGILHCVIETEHANVHCFVVHLGLFAGSRRRQTEMLIETVAATAPAGVPVIIAGDFNDWGNELSDLLRQRLGVREVFDGQSSARGIAAYLQRLTGKKPEAMPARTFPASMPLLPMDRIYVRGFEVESAKVLQGLRWSRLSDHAPIVATLELRQPRRNKS
ncbi:MAG: endonuclease/exonuclease/phosphatase family protein [Burkholderiaceae bacterium]|nr:endonuclease/exonuclease/phosphatase family protein [Burkholderiaceae bacterium]